MKKKLPELMKARVVGGDGRTTSAELTLLGKKLTIQFDGARHGERALVWAQSWNDHCIRCMDTIKSIEADIMDEFAEALVFRGVDFATIEMALDDCKTGNEDDE
jgi:hypothetical protein